MTLFSRLLRASNVINFRNCLSFRRDERGITILMVALLLIPLATAIAVAVDLSRVSLSKAQLQQSVDNAALSAALTYSRQLVENGGNAPDAYDRALASGQSIFNANYPGATLELTLNVNGGFNGTARTTVDNTLAAAVGLADANPVAKACAGVTAGGVSTLTTTCSTPCRPAAFPELSCNQSACPPGMYDQTYSYNVSGNVTEPGCGTSTFKTKTCSLSCPEAPKPAHCDSYGMTVTFTADNSHHPLDNGNGMFVYEGYAPSCLGKLYYGLISGTIRHNGLYIDENCELTFPFGRVCNFSVIVSYMSPISLIWDDELKIDDSFTLSAFQLDPYAQPGQTYEWRGSSKAPMLVWDEKNDGVITQASQLFGNHTFGKRWSDGYAALDSLDKDKNGSLRGDELKHIRIWFDENANGVSEPGEVKNLADVSITAVHTVPSRKDMKNGFIYADRGYDRVIGGKTVTKPSVDWMSKAYKKPSEASSNSMPGSSSTGNSGGTIPASSSSSSTATPSSSASKSTSTTAATGANSNASGKGADNGAGGSSTSSGSSSVGSANRGSGGAATGSGQDKNNKAVALDIAGVWQVTLAPLDNADNLTGKRGTSDGTDDTLGSMRGITFVAGSAWNELSGFIFEPYGPLNSDPESAKLQRNFLEKNYPFIPLYPDTREGISTLRDIFLKGLKSIQPGTNPDSSTWGFKYPLTGSYAGKNTYNFESTNTDINYQTLYSLVFNEGADTFKGTMTLQIPGRGKLKREFTGKRLKTLQQ